MAVVVMGGLTGGGGRLLGAEVARRLQIDYVDRLILTNTAKHIGSTVEVLHQREEIPPTRGQLFMSALESILERSVITGGGFDPFFGPGSLSLLTHEYEDMPRATITKSRDISDDHYLESIHKVMVQLAKQDNVVIVGRGGAVLLRNFSHVLRVGTVANFDDRIARIMERDKLGKKQAKDIVDDRDRAREFYFKRYWNIDNPDDPGLYHMVINTSDIGITYASEIVIQACDSLAKGELTKSVNTTA